MKFTITDLLLTTTAYAALLVLARADYDGFLISVAILFLLQVFCPVAIVFTTIVFADQRGQMLDVSTNRAYLALRKLWLLSLICSGLLVCTFTLIAMFGYVNLMVTLYGRRNG